MDEKVQEEARERAARFLEFVQKTADAANVRCNTVVATNAHPYDAIVDTANKLGCDLIVMTARNRKGLAKLVMGNEASRVLHRASIPVLIFRAIMSSDHPDKGSPAK
jgi:nucleotide-binding universal stress UspA family protein